MLSTFEQASVWLTPHPKLDGVSMIDHLFNRLNGTYPNKWRANFRDQQAIEDWKDAWAEAFDDEGITPNDVALGIKNCRRMFDWPPSLTEFLRACRPNLEPGVAFFEAVRGMQERRKGNKGHWSHPAIYHAAVMVGQHDLLSASYQNMESRWKKALADQLALGSWTDVPNPAPALPAPGQDIVSNEEGRKRVEQLAEKAIMPNKSDQKAWAHKILAKPKGFSPAVVAMARRALELEVA